MEKKPDREYASVEDAETALSGLSDADWLRLDMSARLLVSNNEIVSPENLLKEAIENVLSGSRKWPSDVNFTTFLYNVMRSMADGYRKKQQRMFQLLDNEVSGNERGNPEDQLIEAEHEKLVQAKYKEIWDLFSGDNIVEGILLGREENLSPMEIQKHFDISETQYASALRRMRRKLLKTYPEGWQTW